MSSCNLLEPSYMWSSTLLRKLYHNSEKTDNLTPLKVSTAQKFVQSCPQNLQPYLQLMRIDRPIGSWLLFWPCAWSLALAAPATTIIDLPLLCLFAFGSIVMRGAGCTINDMWDRDIDSKVTRTIGRPLASKSVSLVDAFSFLGLQLGVGCSVLLKLNWYSIILGGSSLGLVLLYPLMKRVTYWPQLMLGFTINWGALLGWSALQECCDWSVCLPLYFAGVCWTLIYDTIYAHQDKSEDVSLGMKSTAILFGKSTRPCLAAFSTCVIAALSIAGVEAGQTWPFFLGVSAVGLHLARQISTLDIDNAQDCGEKFKSNYLVGWILFIGILGGNLVKKINCETENRNKNNTLGKDGSAWMLRERL